MADGKAAVNLTMVVVTAVSITAATILGVTNRPQMTRENRERIVCIETKLERLPTIESKIDELLKAVR